MAGGDSNSQRLGGDGFPGQGYGAGRFMQGFPGQGGLQGQTPFGGLMPWDYQVPQPQMPAPPPLSALMPLLQQAAPAIAPLAAPRQGGHDGDRSLSRDRARAASDRERTGRSLDPGGTGFRG